MLISPEKWLWTEFIALQGHSTLWQSSILSLAVQKTAANGKSWGSVLDLRLMNRLAIITHMKVTDPPLFLRSVPRERAIQLFAGWELQKFCPSTHGDDDCLDLSYCGPSPYWYEVLCVVVVIVCRYSRETQTLSQIDEKSLEASFVRAAGILYNFLWSFALTACTNVVFKLMF